MSWWMGLFLSDDTKRNINKKKNATIILNMKQIFFSPEAQITWAWSCCVFCPLSTPHVHFNTQTGPTCASLAALLMTLTWDCWHGLLGAASLRVDKTRKHAARSGAEGQAHMFNACAEIQPTRSFSARCSSIFVHVNAHMHLGLDLNGSWRAVIGASLTPPTPTKVATVRNRKQLAVLVAPADCRCP